MNFNHKHMIITAHNISNPPEDIITINTWLLNMVEAIDMKVLIGPYSIMCDTLGNEGVTGVIVIETSHISCHCWNAIEKPFMNVDIYSCKDFDEIIVQKMFKQFRPEYIDYMIIDRNKGNNNVIGEGRLEF